jgi:flagellin
MSSINTNVAAIKARSNLDRVQRDMDTSIARLSSGKRITRAHDDAAGSAIAGRMESQIRGINMNIRAAKDGQSLVDTQEGALQEVTSMLQRMRELAVQSESGALAAKDRDYLQLELGQLFDEINAISANTKFNDVNVMTGASFSFYTDIDVKGTAITTVEVSASAQNLMTSISSISIGSGQILGSTSGVQASIIKLDAALVSVASMRANLGAVSNRFDHVIDNLTTLLLILNHQKVGLKTPTLQSKQPN